MPRAILVPLTLLALAGCGDRVVGEYPCGDGRNIVLFSRSHWDPGGTSIVYQVRPNGGAGSRRIDLGLWYTSDSIDAFDPRGFEALVSDDGSLCAVVRRDKRFESLVLHYFTTGESWPRDGPGVGDVLRTRLANDFPDVGTAAMLSDDRHLKSLSSLHFPIGICTASIFRT